MCASPKTANLQISNIRWRSKLWIEPFKHIFVWREMIIFQFICKKFGSAKNIRSAYRKYANCHICGRSANLRHFEVRGIAICGFYLHTSQFCCTQFFNGIRKPTFRAISPRVPGLIRKYWSIICRQYIFCPTVSFRQWHWHCTWAWPKTLHI